MTNLFSWELPLPYPFANIDKRVSKDPSLCSKHSANTESTLIGPLLKALLAYAKMRGQEDCGGVGMTGERCCAEYAKSKVGIIDLMLYDPDTGLFSGGTFDTHDGKWTQYVRTSSQSDGAAMFLAMMPVFLADDEFAEMFDLFDEQYAGGFVNAVVMRRAIYTLCDNVYRRVKDEAVKVDIPISGEIELVDALSVFNNAVNKRLRGSFAILPMDHTATPEIFIPHDAFIGPFRLAANREFTDEERRKIPQLPSWYQIPKCIHDVCNRIYHSTGTTRPIRNIMLRGAAGTGKTDGAMAAAAALGLPYMIQTCHADMQVSELIGEFLPVIPSIAGNPETELHDGLLDSLNLPSSDSMQYDPVNAYAQITGVHKAQATPQDCLEAVLNIISTKLGAAPRITAAAQDGNKFEYQISNFLQAIMKGYLVEIQEPANIIRPGVLVGLNSLLDQGGVITLPNGETIKRHPDCVVVLTTNVDYEGCRRINQAVNDRMNHFIDLPELSVEDMARRAVAITGFDNDCLARKMADTVKRIEVFCRDSEITDGSCGMRALIDWMTAAKIEGDYIETANDTVIRRATSNIQAQNELRSSILENVQFLSNAA